MSSLSRCFQIDSYTEAWECLGNAPHTAGHGVLGLAIDVALTPGDPVFYLHVSQVPQRLVGFERVSNRRAQHAWLDVMWWKWQTLDLPNRLTDMGGRNYPTAGFLAMLNMDPPGPEWTDYYGDPANTTTLDHVLTQVSIVPNITVGDIMDVGDETICADYIFSESMERFVRGF